MLTFCRPAWGLALALLCGCAPPAPRARVADGFVVAEALDLPTPPLPTLCTAPPAGPRQWVFFSSQRCAYCRAMRQELVAALDQWSARGVEVVELVVDAASCDQAAQLSERLLPSSADRRRWAVGLADPNTVHQWGVERTPLVVMVHQGRAQALFVGQAPVSALLAAHDRRAKQ